MGNKRAPFDSRRKHYARRTFKFSGRVFTPDTYFNWRRMSCSLRKLSLLYNAGKLKYIDDELEPKTPDELDDDLPVIPNESDNVTNESNDHLDSSDCSNQDSEPDDDSGDPDDEDELEPEENKKKSTKKQLPKPRRRNRNK